MKDLIGSVQLKEEKKLFFFIGLRESLRKLTILSSYIFYWKIALEIVCITN